MVEYLLCLFNSFGIKIVLAQVVADFSDLGKLQIVVLSFWFLKQSLWRVAYWKLKFQSS